MSASNDSGIWKAPPNCTLQLDTLSLYLVTHVSLFLACLGMVTNAICVIVLYKDPVRTTTRYILMILAVEDMAIIVLGFIYYVISNYYDYYELRFLGYKQFIDSICRFLINWIKMTEIYTVVLVSLDRYIGIAYPLRSVSLCRVSKARQFIITVSAIAFCLKLPDLIINYEVGRWSETCHFYLLKPLFDYTSEWYSIFQMVYVNLLDQLVAFVIPLISLIILNVCLIRQIRYADNNRMALNGSSVMGADKTNASSQDNFQVYSRSMSACSAKKHSSPGTPLRMTSETSDGRLPRPRRNNVTITLIGIVTIFIVCEVPTSAIFINNLLDPSKRSSAVGIIVYPMALVGVFINCASNFFVYILVGRKFRNMFLRLFCRRCSKAGNQSDNRGRRWDGHSMATRDGRESISMAPLTTYQHNASTRNSYVLSTVIEAKPRIRRGSGGSSGSS